MMNANPSICRSLQRGLSLIELMISITLGLLLTAAVIQVFLSSRGVFRTQDSMSRLQENGRFAVDFMTRDIRMAGFIGCPVLDRIAGSGSFNRHGLVADFDAEGIVEGSVVGTGVTVGTIPLAAGTDRLTIRKTLGVSLRLAAATTGSSVQVLGQSATLGINVGDTLLISDCLAADVFRANAIGSGTNPTITSSASLSKSYGTDAEVLRYEAVEYFIGDTGRNTPGGADIFALYANRGGGAEELVEGVQSLRIEYGLDTTGSDHGADVYRATSAMTTTDWSRVVSVRVNLLMQSVEDAIVGSSGAQTQSLTFMGSAVAADGRLRQVFSSAIAIRNRLP